MFFNGKGFLANTTPVQNNYTNPNTVPYCIKSNKYQRCNGGESILVITMEPCDRNVFKYTYMYAYLIIVIFFYIDTIFGAEILHRKNA